MVSAASPRKTEKQRDRKKIQRQHEFPFPALCAKAVSSRRVCLWIIFLSPETSGQEKHLKEIINDVGEAPATETGTQAALWPLGAPRR